MGILARNVLIPSSAAEYWKPLKEMGAWARNSPVKMYVESPLVNIRNFECTLPSSRDVLWKDFDAGFWSIFHERLSKQAAQLEKLNIISECQILKKILFKHQNQMRRDKSFQYAKKVQKLSERYLKLELVNSLRSILSVTGKLKHNNLVLAKNVSTPSSEYIAIIKERLIGAAKLAVVISFTCEHASRFLCAHMQYGFFIHFNMFAIASVARIRFAFKQALEYMEAIYIILKEALGNICSWKTGLPTSLSECIVDVLLGYSEGLIKDNSATNFKEEKSEPWKQFATNLSMNQRDFGEPIALEDAKKLRNSTSITTEIEKNVENGTAINNEASTKRGLRGNLIVRLKEQVKLENGFIRAMRMKHKAVKKRSQHMRSRTPALNSPFRKCMQKHMRYFNKTKERKVTAGKIKHLLAHTSNILETQSLILLYKFFSKRSKQNLPK